MNKRQTEKSRGRRVFLDMARLAKQLIDNYSGNVVK
jgi:hypothetical protein